MAGEVLLFERQQNYATITLNRPEKRNALNEPMLKALDEALVAVEHERDVLALIVRGAGASFCSGIDLAEADRLEGGHSPVNVERVFHRLENVSVPTIAAMQGPALAGGCELGLHCDLRIGAEDLRMGMTVARVGLLVPYDFIRKLIEIIGAANTAQILYTAEPVDAARALSMGLVHEVVPAAKLGEAAIALAQKVSGNAPLSLRTMKKSLRRSLSESNDAFHQDILEMGRMVRASQDAREGIRAFLEKRKPNWKGE
ncbi:MAG TPA: enoyl-CoA hydratase-related protein [Candidatus Binataceae bacterium]|nr:enoyl-CoA hydratase-related protein [Candidatus Binataceae bacterium]